MLPPFLPRSVGGALHSPRHTYIAPACGWRGMAGMKRFQSQTLIGTEQWQGDQALNGTKKFETA